jgi:hypothetical protein
MTYRLRELQIELCGVCNATCSYCEWQARSLGRQKMETELALSLVRQADDLQVPLVTFHGVGESTLHPRCAPIVGCAEARGLRTRLSTNCYRLDGDLASDLAQMENLEMILALHAGLPPSFMDICREHALDYLARAPGNRAVEVLVVCTEEGAAYVPRVLDEFLPLVERLPCARIHLKQPVTWPKSAPVKGVHPLHHALDKLQVDLHIMETPMSIGRDCAMPEYLLQVLADGTCTPCCVDTGDWGLPDVRRAGLAGVWNSPQMENLREKWREASMEIPCGHCKTRTDC